MIRKLAPLLALVFVPAFSGADEDAVERAERLFEEGDFAEGRVLLLRALGETRDLPEQQARVLAALARFYEQLAGDLDQSAEYLGRILKLPLPEGHPTVAGARERIADRKAQTIHFQAQNEILERAKRLTGRGGEMERESSIVELRRLCARHPDFPQLAAAYHYLGELSFLLGRNRQAYQAFCRAMELRPAIGYYLPAPTRKDLVFRRWIREVVRKATWGFLGVALVVTAILFYWSRPWRWFGLREAFVSVSLVFFWWLLFRASVWFTGGDIEIPQGRFEEPVYSSVSPGSPFSEVLNTLFGYSLVGLLGTVVLCVATARFRPRYTWSLVRGIFGLLLLSSLLSVFYLRHCRAFVTSEADGRFPFLGGTFCYSDINGQIPYILINPTAYPGFHQNILNIDEGEFRVWFEQYASPDQPTGNEEAD